MKLPENISKLFDKVESGKLTAKEAKRKIKKLWGKEYIIIEDDKVISLNEFWEHSFYTHLKRLERRNCHSESRFIGMKNLKRH
jgi:hypothetical protein